MGGMSKGKAPKESSALACGGMEPTSSESPVKKQMATMSYAEQAALLSPSGEASAETCESPTSWYALGPSESEGTCEAPAEWYEPQAVPEVIMDSGGSGGAGGASGADATGGSGGASGRGASPKAPAKQKTTEPPKVDDKKVQEWINKALAQAPKGASEAMRADLGHAWLYQQRQSHPNTEVNLAAAEHYMYNRAQVAKGGTTSAVVQGAMTAGYDVVKGTAQLFGVGKWLSTDDREPSPASVESTAWGMKGIGDGMSDYGQSGS